MRQKRTLLLSSAIITLYFVVRSWLDERKLLVYHGDICRRYLEKVPSLIPLPWKFLKAEEVKALLKQNIDAESKAAGSPGS